MRDVPVAQTCTGSKNKIININTDGNVYFKPVFNIVLSEVRAFDKVLLSVKKEDFFTEVLKPYFDMQSIEQGEQLQLLENWKQQFYVLEKSVLK